MIAIIILLGFDDIGAVSWLLFLFLDNKSLRSEKLSILQNSLYPTDEMEMDRRLQWIGGELWQIVKKEQKYW